MIAVDDREFTQHPEIEQLLPSFSVGRMDAGDYAFMDYQMELVGIERAEVNNLIQKVQDGELELQLRKAEKLYTRFYLLIEGVWDNHAGKIKSYKKKGRGQMGYQPSHQSGFQFDRLQAFLLGLDRMGIIRVYSANFEDSMQIVKLIEADALKPPEARQLFRRVMHPVLPEVPRDATIALLMVLCPRLAEKTAIELVNLYGTVWGVLGRPEKEVLKVDGFGKTHLKHLKENLGL